MNTLLIKMFNAALVENTVTASDFQLTNTKALKIGYLVPQEICNESVRRFLDEQGINPNATFYKSFNDVTDKSRLDILFEQLLHYLSTYGTDFSIGNGYVPNNGEEQIIPFETYKVISVITPEELFDKCYDMLCSGIALKQNTMIALADYVVEFFSKNPKEVYVNVNDIKNKEAQTYLCDKLSMYPTEPNSLLRYIVYKTTGRTMLIKDPATINSIINASSPFDFNKLNEEQLISLSSLFLRFKPLFLAFKKNVNAQNKHIINKLRRLAVKNHKPMTESFWQNVFTKKYTIEELEKNAEKLTNYKKVALMQLCLYKLFSTSYNQFYLIRNQKAFLREEYKAVCYDEIIKNVLKVLQNSLVESLKKNVMTSETISREENGEIVTETINRPKIIKMHSEVEIALPTSEKSFIGNYPFGTSYPLSANNYIGIYWRNEWGTYDYDLSLLNYDGDKIGWNSSYYTGEKDIIYSGDMTNADPEAAEVIYIKKNGDLKALIKINQFRGNPTSKYEFYFGQDKINNLSVNYMVNPNSIKLTTEVPVDNIKEQTIGLIANGKITLMAINTGNLCVSYGNKHTQNMMSAIEEKTKSFILAKDILKEAGYTIVDETYTGNVDIDFTNMQKDSIIALMK